MADIRLVAFDMDGTFMRDDHTYDVERFGRIFERGSERDVRFACASGNQYLLMRNRFTRTYQHMGFAADNGADVWVGDELISCRTMSPEDAALGLESAYTIEGAQRIAGGIKSAWLQNEESQQFYDFMTNYNPVIQWTDDIFTIDDELVKISLILDAERVDALTAMLNDQLAGRLVAVKSAATCIDIIQFGVNKATGLAALAEHWGIAAEECVCFGDSGNDVEMLEWCGRGFAMANSDPVAIEAADEVCPSNEEDGVLVTLEHLFG